MKIAIIGASGVIGQGVSKLLKKDHNVICLGRDSGDINLDICDKNSIINAFKQMGKVDAVICTSGKVAFGKFDQLDDEDWQLGLKNKLMGQINLAQIASQYLNHRGSITLTSGIIGNCPIALGISAATVNGALESFVRAVALELPDQQRINIVSPTVLTESLPVYQDFFPGFASISADDLSQFYKRSVMGVETGQVFEAFAGN